jgi:hypothetical protein
MASLSNVSSHSRSSSPLTTHPPPLIPLDSLHHLVVFLCPHPFRSVATKRFNFYEDDTNDGVVDFVGCHLQYGCAWVADTVGHNWEGEVKTELKKKIESFWDEWYESEWQSQQKILLEKKKEKGKKENQVDDEKDCLTNSFCEHSINSRKDTSRNKLDSLSFQFTSSSRSSKDRNEETHHPYTSTTPRAHSPPLPASPASIPPPPPPQSPPILASSDLSSPFAPLASHSLLEQQQFLPQLTPFPITFDNYRSLQHSKLNSLSKHFESFGTSSTFSSISLFQYSTKHSKPLFSFINDKKHSKKIALVTTQVGDSGVVLCRKILTPPLSPNNPSNPTPPNPDHDYNWYTYPVSNFLDGDVRFAELSGNILDAQVNCYEIKSGDVLIGCTDGFWDLLTSITKQSGNIWDIFTEKLRPALDSGRSSVVATRVFEFGREIVGDLEKAVLDDFAVFAVFV